MMRLDKTLLQARISHLLSRKGELQWLVDLGVQATTIANFGCHIGGETLAIMWTLGASEAVGIDKDEQAVLQARDTLTYIQDDVKRIWLYMQHYSTEISEDDRTWWNDSVPSFFKRELLRDGCVSYLVRDITKPTGLPSGYYDVAFCDFVLHHIWYDAGRENPREDTSSAIKEMTRVVRPGGVVAASELVQYPDKQRLDFKPLFKEARLECEYIDEREVDSQEGRGVIATYLCRKPLVNEN
jgi:SAM-dependent methyltransferase